MRAWPGLGRVGLGRRGTVAVIGAVAMTSIVGMTGFAIDFGVGFAQLAQLQKVGDSAAMAGAMAWNKMGTTAAVNATISSVVVANGWPASTIVSASTGYMAQSPKVSSNAAVQVKLSALSTLSLTRAITSSTTMTASSYSVVQINGGSSAACILALWQLMINGSVNVNGCSAVANSNSSNAITVNSGGALTATIISTPGNIVANGTVTGTVKTGATAVRDPYSSYQSQASNGFTNCQSYNNQSSLTPGCWSNVNINTAVTLSAGAYYFTNINVNSGGSITGTGGVTMVMQQSFSPNGNITITAPSDTNNKWRGMGLYLMNGMNFNSGVQYNISGAVYAPTSTLIPNNATWNQSACTYLVAQYITFNSGAAFTLPQNNCGFYNYPKPGIGTASTVALVQ